MRNPMKFILCKKSEITLFKFLTIVSLFLALSFLAPSSFAGSIRCHQISRIFITPDLVISTDVFDKSSTWQKELRRLQSKPDRQEEIQIQNELSGFAAKLVREKRNQDFFFLISQFNFPFKRTSVFDNNGNQQMIGASILESIILSDNQEVYERLPLLLAQDGRSSKGIYEITNWTTDLAQAAEKSKYFSELARTFQVRSGGNQHSVNLKEHGRMTDKTLQALQDVATTGSVNRLVDVLQKLYLNGILKGTSQLKTQPMPADLWWEMSLPNKSNQWVQIQIIESAKLKTGPFGLEAGRPVRFHLEYLNEVAGEIGVSIHELSIANNQVTIRIERSNEKSRIDSADRFTELKIIFDDDRRITTVTLQSGNSLILKRFWRSNSVDIPKESQSSATTYVPGDEDLGSNKY